MNLSSFTKRAFTLIELLVVITIIAVLAGLLLPVTGKVMENARKTSARSTEAQIVSAVNQYQTEYGSYPVPTVAAADNTPTDFTFDDTGSSNTHNGILFDVLRAINSTSDTKTGALNTRRIVYFEMKNVKNITTPKDGFIATGTPKANNGKGLVVGDLVDPWGNLYFVRMDSNYTNVLMNPYSSPGAPSDSDNASNPPAATDNKVLRTGAISYCWGADGLPGNKNVVGSAPWAAAQGDDVTSWQ